MKIRSVRKGFSLVHKIRSGAGILLLAALVLSSCGSKKMVTSGETKSNLSAKQIIRNHYQNDVDFETLRGRVKVDYTDGNSDQGFSVSLRMKKDEAIWLAATLSVVKVLITPDRVSFYNKLDNTYFDGDFTLLNELLGTEVNFTMVQNLLLGQSIYDLKDQRYTASIAENLYQLKPDRQLELFKLLFLLEPSNFKIALQQLSQPEKGRILNIAYESYQDVEGKVVPDKISLEALDGAEITRIDLEYRNLEFDQQVTFPYSIPIGYKPIELE
ncbi:DUF4292 domain-containing protein [Robertkochia flava]|uniref:DUF4292 domain-containing protein n=1 Tax=Robertkochia flava TaxID=3447986 RepID=UPI001CCE26F5|nr:DUF4292 domain-containing protein [Robertkochia marina]